LKTLLFKMSLPIAADLQLAIRFYRDEVPWFGGWLEFAGAPGLPQ
jgi:hypothetical protein